jgi:hypothetical protein
MIRFIRRHLEPHGARVREQRRVRTTTGALRASIPAPAAARHAAPRVLRVPLLTLDDATRVCDAVLDSRARWRARRDSLAFHTLGAAAHLDALDDVDAYTRFARLDNAFLRSRFPALYDALISALGAALGAPAVLHDEWALPGFRIARAQRGASLPLGAIRPDVHHLALASEPVRGLDCVSFSLCVNDDVHDTGVRVWPVLFEDTIGLDSEEIARVLDAGDESTHTHEPGALLVRPGNAYAQRLPMRETVPGTEIVTLEGHAFRENGAWRVYW